MKGEQRFIYLLLSLLGIGFSTAQDWGALYGYGSGGSMGVYRMENFANKNYGFSEYCKPTPEALGVYNGTITDAQMTAPPNSWARQREPWKARLYHNSAWQAETNDYLQYLQVDFGNRHVLMAVATQGMRGSLHWVTQYKLLFSNDEKNWEPITEKNGEPKLFIGNDNADSIKLNVLEFPIVARYIRINPQRWSGFIAMRVELYGCKFDSHQAFFAGKGIVQYDVTGPVYQVRSRNDFIRLRFRTSSPFGLLFYAGSSQGDFFSIELYRGILKVSVNLGTGSSDIYAGSLLDDNQWHDVDIVRESHECNITIDRLKTVGKLVGDFLNLDVDSTLNLGGLTTFTHMHGVTTKHNFTGCIENIYFNDLNMLRDVTEVPMRPRYRVDGGVQFQCMMDEQTAITFDSFEAHIEYMAQGEKGRLRIHLVFRTYNPDGIMVYYKFGLFEFVIKLSPNGYLQYTIQGLEGSEDLEDTIKNRAEWNENGIFNDGLWHEISFLADRNRANFTVDKQVRITTHPMNFDEIGDGKYMIGSGPEGYPGYLGCMQGLSVGTKSIVTATLKEGARSGAAVGSCAMRDRCHPNPCEHNGACTQDWSTFYCDCEGTGYTGAVCHLSAHFQSCTEAKETNKDAAELATIIDVDGSGPLKPFKVTCDFKEGIKTKVSHRYMEEMLVDGFDDPGSYRREIIYDADVDQLTAMIERASKCQQSINYKCRAARLLAQPPSPFDRIRGFGWWVSRTKQPMYYWGGAAPGTYKCACGVSGTCDGKQERCNCDANDENQWKSDDGLLQDKGYLPVMELRFGDTGTLLDRKQAKHKLGALECFGDALYENSITFRKADATVEFPPLQYDEIDTLDIRFQFRTTSDQGTFIHSTGENQFMAVSYNSGTIVSFRFNVGRGVEAIEVISPSKLNDGIIWHTVTVERNRKEYYMKVDMLAPVTRPEPINQGYKNFWFTENFTVGATVDFRNGYVGCMRGLQVNGELYDIRGKVAREESTYGLSQTCVPKCASNPCINNGDCKEGFSDYTCDCTYTPWRGYICGREVGTNLGSGDMIKYVFDAKGSLATEEEVITVGFATQEKKGILMKIVNPDNDEYISIELNNNGGVTVYYNFGAKSGGPSSVSTQTLEQGVDLTNNQQHVVKFRRTKGGRNLILQVDEYTPALKDLNLAPGADTKLNGPKFIYMGKDEGTKTGEGFTGCIYRAKFNNIYPLKLAFNAPRPPNIILSPPDLREDKCGFEEILPPHEPYETRTLDAKIEAPPPLYKVDRGRHDALLGGILAAVFVVLIIIIIIVACQMTKQKGAYKTQEAKGTENAENPDFAILQERSGQPEVSRKREIFI
ncbi:neurexin-4-like isoform X1 [Lineus longissimus]|uniref:neurexin-4-like isoform X1 n=1 Tax=Lineus longissimus TaxID=88925 RepID=UPI00315D66BE